MLLGLLLVAIPFAFAALRAVATAGADLRYVWVALAAAMASWAVLVVRGRGARPTVGAVAGALVAATAAASVAGFVQGAQSVPAVLFVAAGFAICEVGGLALARRAKRTAR